VWKRNTSTYRGRGWVKVKNRRYRRHGPELKAMQKRYERRRRN
jgi:hypothetical protein